MDFSRETMKHLNRLCESVLRRYDIASREQLRDVLQRELSVTLSNVLNSNSLVSDDNDMFPSEGVAVIMAPLNSLEDVARNAVDGKVEIYLKVPYYLDTPDVVTGDGGEEFLNTRSVPESTKVYLGSLKYDKSKCSLVLSDELDPSFIDLDLYAICWNTTEPRNVCDLLNDIYSRMSKKGVYVTGNSLTSKTNDAVKHISYAKLLGYAKGMYPLTFGNETALLRNVLEDMLGTPVQDFAIAKPDDDVCFTVVLEDKSRDLTDAVNAVLENYF